MRAPIRKIERVITWRMKETERINKLPLPNTSRRRIFEFGGHSQKTCNLGCSATHSTHLGTHPLPRPRIEERANNCQMDTQAEADLFSIHISLHISIPVSQITMLQDFAAKLPWITSYRVADTQTELKHLGV